MRYYAARACLDGSGWHFTCRHDRATYPVGTCDQHPPHMTKQEAEECWIEYATERFITDALFRPTKTEPWGPCVVCKARTPYEYRDSLTGAHLRMCDAHANVDTVIEHLKVPTMMAVS